MQLTEPKERRMAKEAGMMSKGGHLYTQTNEIENVIIHYQRGANGSLTEVERVRTGGAGSGVFKPISGQESAPNAFEGANSVIITADRRFLFATNGGDNSVSSFSIGQEGELKLLDVKPTGNPVEGKSGTAKSVAYRPSSKTLYVLHSFGPDHVRLMSVSADGKLAPRPDKHTINTHDKTDRVSTMVVLSPNEKFLFVGTTSGSSERAAHITRSPRMPRILTALASSPSTRTAPSARAS
jgi:WD40 repeat protein